MVRIDRTKKPVKDRVLAVPGMIFLTGYNQAFGVPHSYTMCSIALMYVSAPIVKEGESKSVKKEALQVMINVGDKRGNIRKTYYINAGTGESKMVGDISLSEGDVVSINTSSALSPASSACLTYIMKIKSKEV